MYCAVVIFDPMWNPTFDLQAQVSLILNMKQRIYAIIFDTFAVELFKSITVRVIIRV